MMLLLGLALFILSIWAAIMMARKTPKLGEIPEIIKAGGGLKVDPCYSNRLYCERLSINYQRTEAEGVVVETMDVLVGKLPFSKRFLVTFRNGRPVQLSRNGFNYNEEELAMFSGPQRMALGLLNTAVERTRTSAG